MRQEKVEGANKPVKKLEDDGFETMYETEVDHFDQLEKSKEQQKLYNSPSEYTSFKKTYKPLFTGILDTLYNSPNIDIR